LKKLALILVEYVVEFPSLCKQSHKYPGRGGAQIMKEMMIFVDG